MYLYIYFFVWVVARIHLFSANKWGVWD